jgi:hypothetical protein
MTTDNDSGRVSLVDVVNAASDTLRDVETGVLRPAEVEARAVDACRELFGVVGSGPSDPLWELHADTSRQFLAAGGISADEIAEWLAVQRRREAGS